MSKMTPEKLRQWGVFQPLGLRMDLEDAASAWDADLTRRAWFEAQHITDTSNLLAAEERIRALERRVEMALAAMPANVDGGKAIRRAYMCGRAALAAKPQRRSHE